MPRAAEALIAATVLSFAAGPLAGAEKLAVEMENASERTLCAESDNIYLRLTSPEVRRFTIDAIQPAYLDEMIVDHTAPHFANCDMSKDPVFKAEPREYTIFENDDVRLVGITYSSFWRPATVPVRVGARVEHGLHLLQLWFKYEGRADEALVVYPPDGYWRPKPLPGRKLGTSVYGSSFLIGPIEYRGRPLVEFREVEFDPASRTFMLRFARGGAAALRVDRIDRNRITLDVTFDAPMTDLPFAALRSMFVTEGFADVAHVALRKQPGGPMPAMPVLDFKREKAVEMWTGRLVVSLHNSSAPDVIFRDFAGR